MTSMYFKLLKGYNLMHLYIRFCKEYCYYEQSQGKCIYIKLVDGGIKIFTLIEIVEG